MGANWDLESCGEESAAARGFLSVTPVEPLFLLPSIGQKVCVTTASTRRSFNSSLKTPPWGMWKDGQKCQPVVKFVNGGVGDHWLAHCWSTHMDLKEFLLHVFSYLPKSGCSTCLYCASFTIIDVLKPLACTVAACYMLEVLCHTTTKQPV